MTRRRPLHAVNEFFIRAPLALAIIIIAATVGAVAVIGAVQIGNNTRSIETIKRNECYAIAFRVAQSDYVTALTSRDPDAVKVALPAYKEAADAERDHAVGKDTPCPLEEP